MADGFLSKYLENKANIYSAGIEVHGLNPKAVEAMAELNIDISSNTSNHVDEYQSINFDYVITVCDHAREVCPVFPSTSTKLHESFPDPAKATGSLKEIMNEFRTTRNLIDAYCQKFAGNLSPAYN